MEICSLRYPLTEQSPLSSNPIVMAIGDFDGVHLGHQEVIRTAKRIADENDCLSAIMTFHPHPREVLGQKMYSRYLAPYVDKMERFAALDLDFAYTVHFDKSFARVTSEQFVEEMLIKMNIHTVVVGFDFTFGYLGAGTVDSLIKLANGRFAVEMIKPYHLNGEKVSSTVIREQLHFGFVDAAKEYLGRPYQLAGKVVHGEARGRSIGFPTANIEVTEPFVIPSNGVYLVKLHLDGKSYDGVMNIGVKPTFHVNASVTIEAHLFDFNQDIYNRIVQVELLSFLRPEQRFNSIDELINQIHADVEVAKAKLAE